MSTPNTTTQTPNPATPPAAPANPNTTTPPAATTLENPSQSGNPGSTPGSSNEPTPPAPVTPPANTPAGEPVTPPAAEPAPATPPSPAVPEFQEYELEVDENSPLTEEELLGIAKYAEKYGLSKEDAQAIVASQEASYRKAQTAVETHYTQQIEQRRQQLNSHPDFSGEKAKDSWASVKLAAEAFGSPELMAALSDPNKHGYDLSVALVLKNIGDQLRPEGAPPGKGVHVPAFVKAQTEEEARLRRQYPSFYKDEK